MRKIFSVLVVVAITLNMVGCSMSSTIQSKNLMEGMKRENPTGKNLDEKFLKSTEKFSIELFKKSIKEGENSLISPISVMLALAMTTNGADGETKTEMEKLLGDSMKIEELNKYLYTYVKNLYSSNDSKVKTANSIWYKDDKNILEVKKTFLQTNLNYYNAEVYKSPFDKSTLKDINNWIDKNTDGMIKNMLNKIDVSAVMYLINSVVFDAKWESEYNKNHIKKGKFTCYNKEIKTVDMMSSNESFYLDDGRATGFIKPYKDNKYSFVALLPNKDVSIDDYVASLDSDKFLKIIKDAKTCSVEATIPKFSYEYFIELNNVLKDLGIKKAFDEGKADFNNMAKASKEKIYINGVLHKTFISVDELGTKAGAATIVEMNKETAMRKTCKVKLDRPFVYVIIDDETNIPIFMGRLMNI